MRNLSLCCIFFAQHAQIIRALTEKHPTIALNPFEQLNNVSVEPRQAFEEAVADMLRLVYPKTRRVRIHQGDGGVDAFRGTYGKEGGVEVYQIKYFPGPFTDSRKQQIRDSYATALNSPDYKLKKWILCVPVRLTKDDLRWFDTWSNEQDTVIELLDGDELTDMLQKDDCALVRRRLTDRCIKKVTERCIKKL